MTAVIARIALRYLAAALVTAGYLDADLGNQIGADSDLIMLVGLALGAGVEMAYAAAKRLGWAT
ncbi:hypothetical protein [Shinella sp. JR1-6]|uniref:hypothetical protein n=1 Tax=Shinella sp. JR1-6 TaxID=2527671 RepID=UPI00102D6593|nr:hypothetical protein [Shinella sp. JR1-6]TAA49295.1 hypothetical protein EXZ48_34420 [Shinella sp. JR1-6]